MTDTTVTLRNQAAANNMRILYLDFYPAIRHPDTNKLTRRYNLGRKIYSETKLESKEYITKKGNKSVKHSEVLGNRKDKNGNPLPVKNTLTDLQKEHNRITLRKANKKATEIQSLIDKGNYSFLSKKVNSLNFLELFEQIADTKGKSTRDIFLCSLKKLKEFAGNKLYNKEITLELCEKFKSFLENDESIGQNTASAYFRKFKRAVADSEKRGLIKIDDLERFNELKIEELDTNIEFLTLEELKNLSVTPCSNELYKLAALFSGATGLRRSDVVNFSLTGIRKGYKGKQYINVTQEKTKKIVPVPLNKSALKILDKVSNESNKPFVSLLNTHWSTLDTELRKWIKDAGISKKITFHCFRHSYACALIHKKVDIFTVSKLLGHKSLSSTVRTYAKVMDIDKFEAAERIEFVDTIDW
jgi:integrase